ncbi:MAG: protein kinase, partial [Chloroflexi bacterium]|nr:protein kinase [Chloroflexota bacterium]
MKCQACGHENREDARFCDQCAAELGPVCSSCQTQNDPGARFCRQCRESLETTQSPSTTPTPAPTSASAPSPVLPSSFANGRYEVKGFLGEGGKKRVYLARDTSLDRDVAVGVIKAEGLDAEGLTRAHREAQSMGRLGDNPHIVTVHDTGEEGGQPYIVQEYMEGGSLEDLLNRSEQNRLQADKAMVISEQICSALEHAHSHGIIHRDLKPGNVWLTADGTAKLGDFGLAVSLDRSRLTQAGMMVGTAIYMSPEQALGSEVTARSDLYALGCVLYEMVAGRPPFTGEDLVAVISQHMNTAPIAPSWHNAEVPRPLETLILRLLEKAPEERPVDASEVAAELRRIRERPTEEPTAMESDEAGSQVVPWGQFIGRREEMEQLKAALENALSGRGSVVMLVGEPGIGKTRLAQEFGVYASLRGAQALSGSCFEGEAAPYRPFVEAFRQYVSRRTDLELRHELGQGAPEVAKLVSEIRQRLPDIPEAPALEPEAERLRLFESVGSFVRTASEAKPIVLFLDDIHWADTPSLLLLRYLARSITSDRVLILCAYRDVELDRTHPLSDVIAALRQDQTYQRVRLRGLPEEDILALLTGIEPSEEAATTRQALATALAQETEGNPFFIHEVLNHLVEERKLVREGGRWTASVASVSELGIPEGVRQVIGRRLSRLSEPCNRMLTLASTMPGGFSWEELRAIMGENDETLLELVEEALRAQIIRERKNEQVATYEFTHALMRHTVYEELSTPRRVMLHRRIGEALEELHAANPEPHLARLAHHFYQAAPGGDIDKAMDYATRAAERALMLLAYEEAAGLYEMALQAIEFQERPDKNQRCELLLALGRTHKSAGDATKTRAAYDRAAEAARELGDPEKLAQAALGSGGTFGGFIEFEVGVYDEELVSLFEEALHALGPEDSTIRVQLLARLAVALLWSDSRERRESLSLEAIDVANREGDNLSLASALNARIWALSGPDSIDERLAATKQLVELEDNDKLGEVAQSASGYAHLAGVSLEIGDRPGLESATDYYARRAEKRESVSIWYLGVLEAMCAITEGRFEEGEALSLQAAAVGQRTGIPNAVQGLGGQMFLLRRDQGRLAELEEAVKGFADQYATMPAWRAALALVYSETDRATEARSEFELLAADEFESIPRDSLWLVAMTALTDVCEAMGDLTRAEILYRILTPHARLNAAVPFGISYFGPVSLFLGKLAAMLEKWQEAAQHFQDAVEMTEKLRARPFLARTQYEFARTLTRDEGGDRERAFQLVTDALESAQDIGMARLVEQTLELKMELQGITSGDIKTSIDAVAATVQTDRPDLRSHAAPDGTVTLLFTDIVGSTPLNERLGDRRWMELLKEHNAIVREQVHAHQGYEVKTEGDGFMLAFSSARRAVECATAIQRAFAKRNETAEEKIEVRAG